MNAETLAKMSPEEKEAFHRDCESKVKTLKYEQKPLSSDSPKDIIPLVKTRLGRLAVQVVHEGGENNLHYHNNSDTTWFVLRGRVKFYGPGDVLIAELGRKKASRFQAVRAIGSRRRATSISNCCSACRSTTRAGRRSA